MWPKEANLLVFWNVILSVQDAIFSHNETGFRSESEAPTNLCFKPETRSFWCFRTWPLECNLLPQWNRRRDFWCSGLGNKIGLTLYWKIASWTGKVSFWHTYKLLRMPLFLVQDFWWKARRLLLLQSWTRWKDDPSISPTNHDTPSPHSHHQKAIRLNCLLNLCSSWPKIKAIISTRNTQRICFKLLHIYIYKCKCSE